MGKHRFLILGSESRQQYLYELLKAKGQDVILSEEYVAGHYDAILLPIPSSPHYFRKIEEYLVAGQFIFGCNFPKNQNAVLCAASIGELEEEKDYTLVDYMSFDSVAYKNAIATAEGAILEAISLSDINLHGSHSLITGFGRCGEILADKLKGLQSRVTVMDRKCEKRAKAFAYGYEAIEFDSSLLKRDDGMKFDFVFNTVPSMVLDKKMLMQLSKDVIIIDISSAPGGVDFDYCNRHGIKAKLALGLPGKYAPKTSAEILLEVIEATL
jgi:dipicolinate synthase subunit A